MASGVLVDVLVGVLVGVLKCVLESRLCVITDEGVKCALKAASVC
jgi:hypothetical protein